MAALTFDPPLMVAAGCGGTGRELAPYVDLERLTLVTRSLTLAPRSSGPPPLLEESPGGLVLRTPLWNPGLAEFLATELPWLVRAGVRVFVSVVAASLGEYAELARRVGRAPGVAGVEVNLSVPDPAGTGLFDAREPFHAGSVVGAVRREVPGDLPVLAKLRPDVSRVVETARAVVDAGAIAVVVGNALPAALADGRPAGLSGPAVRPVALRCVRDVAQVLPRTPVVGAGGVTEAGHVRSYLAAGAVAVQVGTAMLADPTTYTRIRSDLEESP
ncbi:beta/alpha barrel domain-containing protein [Nocardioides campestrisoli]|uniref:dihydroorotate dehydrogenase n=1 Tax=Nocardioides campestrisoli TaxID=2736757 RepID=UPI00163D9D30|nr:dihydroorotate dehydrogenase [Nocardioides campestrisoli]